MMDYGNYSFSTCWNIKRHSNGKSLIEEKRELGFRYVELNYNVTEAMMESIDTPSLPPLESLQCKGRS